MILCAEVGLQFAKDGDHWRCVEHPGLVMLRGDHYRVWERAFGSVDEALRHLAAREAINPRSAAAPPSGHSVGSSWSRRPAAEVDHSGDRARRASNSLTNR